MDRTLPPAALHRYSREELERGWAAAWRPTWPDTLDGALQCPILARIVRLHAFRQRAMAQQRQRLQAAPQRGQPRPARSHAAHTYTCTTPGLDRKRAAAGERDDD